MSFVGTDERDLVYADMRRRIDSINISQPTSEGPTPVTSHSQADEADDTTDQPVTAKSRKVDVDLLSDFKFKACAPPSAIPQTDDGHEIEKISFDASD